MQYLRSVSYMSLMRSVCCSNKECKWSLTFALILCAISIMTNFWDANQAVKYLLRYIVLLLAALILLCGAVKDNLHIKISMISLLWCPFFLYSFARMDINTISDLGLVVIYLFSLCLIFFAKGRIDNFILPIKIIFFISTIYALTTILQLFAPHFVASLTVAITSSYEFDFEHMARYRTMYLAGIVGRVAYSAGYAAVAIAYILLHKRFNIKFYPACLLIEFIALVLSAKRAHFVFCFVSIIYIFGVTRKKRLSTQKLWKLLLSLMAVIITIYLGKTYFSQYGVLSRLFKTYQSFLSGSPIGSGRGDLYKQAWELFLSSPIYGIGWRAFGVTKSNGVILDVHNSYLQILCETGIVGLTLFIIPLFTTFIYTERKLRKAIKYDVKNINKFCLSFSLFIQLFFIFYSLTGSIVLYPIYILLYFFACAMAQASILRKYSQERIK